MELSKCPCCGKAGRRERNNTVFIRCNFSDRYPEPVNKQSHGYRVRCEECGLQTCWWHYQKEADDKWNMRPKDDGLRTTARKLQLHSQGGCK